MNSGALAPVVSPKSVDRFFQLAILSVAIDLPPIVVPVAMLVPEAMVTASSRSSVVSHGVVLSSPKGQPGRCDLSTFPTSSPARMVATGSQHPPRLRAPDTSARSLGVSLQRKIDGSASAPGVSSPI